MLACLDFPFECALRLSERKKKGEEKKIRPDQIWQVRKILYAPRRIYRVLFKRERDVTRRNRTAGLSPPALPLSRSSVFVFNRLPLLFSLSLCLSPSLSLSRFESPVTPRVSESSKEEYLPSFATCAKEVAPHAEVERRGGGEGLTAEREVVDSIASRWGDIIAIYVTSLSSLSKPCRWNKDDRSIDRSTEDESSRRKKEKEKKERATSQRLTNDTMKIPRRITVIG